MLAWSQAGHPAATRAAPRRCAAPTILPPPPPRAAALPARPPRRGPGASRPPPARTGASVSRPTIVTVCTCPASSARRTSVPETPITTCGTSSTRMRSPIPSWRCARCILTPARPAVPSSPHPAARFRSGGQPLPPHQVEHRRQHGSRSPAIAAPANNGLGRANTSSSPAMSGLPPHRGWRYRDSHRTFATRTGSHSPTRRNSQPAAAQARRRHRERVRVPPGTRSSGRTSITSAVPSARRAKKSGACRRARPSSPRQCSQNGWDDSPVTAGSKSISIT